MPAPSVVRAAAGASRRGLSVAEAARASALTFQPLRRSSEPSRRQAGLTEAKPQGALPTPAAAAAAPAEVLVALRRVEQRQRFAKTIAELERYQAAATPLEEPGARVVPRPALARPASSAAAGLPWSRLWARRKDPAPE